MAILDQVCLDNQSALIGYSLDVIEFCSELSYNQPLFVETTEMTEKWRKLNHTCFAIVRYFSQTTAFLTD